MTEFQLDDIQYDDNHATKQKLAMLMHKKQVFTSRLIFPASVQTGIAGYTIGKHYGSTASALIGALAGYMLTKNNKMTLVDRQIIMKKIEAIDNEIASLQKKNVSQQHANTGLMSSDELTEYEYPKYEFFGKLWIPVFDVFNLFRGDFYVIDRIYHQKIKFTCVC